MNEELLLEMDYQVKLFLTLFEDLDSKMRVSGDKPKAITTYNFFSLLNLPTTAGMLGPLRNIWEGGPMGEGYLQPIKAAMTSGLKTGWEMRLMNTIHRNNCLSNVLKNWNSSKDAGEDEDGVEEIRPVGEYYKYKSLAALVLCFEKGDPISAVKTVNGKICCILTDGLKMIEVKMCLGKEKEEVNSMSYITWEVDTKTVLGKLSQRSIDCPVLLLPLLSSSGAPAEGKKYMYTAVTDAWTKLSGLGTFVRY